MLCAKCGADNPTASAYCGVCGSVLASTPNAASSGTLVAPGNVSPIASPATPGTPLPSAQPMIEDAPTLRAEQLQTPAQPAPNEFFSFGTPTAQSTPAPAVTPPSTPGLVSGASYPAQPQVVPGTPGGTYPGQPASMPGLASGASYPAAPGFSSGAYPGQPASMPGLASGASYPAATGFSSGAYAATTPMPGAPTSGVYPGQQSQPGWGAYPGMVPPTPAREQSILIQRMPLWMFITSIIIVASVLAALVLFTGSDWAAGAQTAGVIALVLGVLVLLVFGIRSALGMLASTNPHRRAQVLSATLLALLLFAFGGFGLGGQNSIHVLQAHSMEAQQKWQIAIDEYQASGQSAPSSVDIARTYDEWGNQLSKQQQFSDAIVKFDTAIRDYNQASGQVAQAQKDEVSAYETWASQASQQQKYQDATSHYDELLSKKLNDVAVCDSACQAAVSALDATAYYNFAEQQLRLATQQSNAQAYTSAATSFQKLTTNFPNAPEVQRAHGDFAKALLGEGRADLTTTCASAVPIYTQLSTSFADTPEGQEAATALKQPQAVKGHFTTSIPSGANTPEVGLPQGVSASMSSDQFYAILAKSPVQVVKSDGTFSFPPLKQGTYDLVWGVSNSSNGRIVFLVGQRYVATVGPLCTFDFGDISESFPTP